MTRPLALTLGEPAGIGPDITLAAWQRRARACAAAVLPARRSGLSGAARAPARPGRSDPRGRRRRTPATTFATALPVVALAERVTARARPARRIERAGRDRLDPPRGRRRVRRPRARGRHQSGRQGGALPHRLRRARPHRIPRQARAGADRARRASGDDAVVAGARRRAGDDPSAGARRAAARSPPT